MPKTIPDSLMSLPIRELDRLAYEDARRRQVLLLEAWQSLPVFIRKPEIADYPLIAYTYHVTFKRPVGFMVSEPMWVSVIDPFTGEIVLSSFPDRSHFPDSPGTGIFLGLRYEGMALAGSVEQPLFKAIDEPVWQAGFDRLMRDPLFLSDPNFFLTIPSNPTADELAFAFAYWRQNVNIISWSGLNQKMLYWIRNILYDHHPDYPHAKSDPLTGKPLVKGVR